MLSLKENKMKESDENRDNNMKKGIIINLVNVNDNNMII